MVGMGPLRVFLAAVVAVLLVACGGSDDKDAKGQEAKGQQAGGQEAKATP